jgi:hypothetical protein
MRVSFLSTFNSAFAILIFVEDSSESTGEMNSAELKQKRLLKDG